MNCDADAVDDRPRQRLGELAVPARLGSEVHDDRAMPHRHDHVLVMSRGAGLLGICAVVMTRSAWEHCLARVERIRAWSSDHLLRVAAVPSALDTPSISMNLAPRDWICFLTAARTSKGRDRRPDRDAQWRMACNPATPARG